MKKYLLLLLLAITGFFYHCSDDFLNVTPLNQLSDATFWKNEADVKMGLTACYACLERGGSTRDGWLNVLLLDCGSDNGFDQCWEFGAIASGLISPTSVRTPFGVTTTVRGFFSYYNIQRYNNFLEKIENAQMDEATKDQYKAEVRFLRAYDYFYKLSLYGDMPLVTKVLSADVKMDRTPVADVEKFVLDELEAISKILPTKNNVDSKGHVTSGTALALKARLELHLGKYAEAMADAKKVIDMNVYQLHPDYRSMFLPGNENSKEAILEINYAKNFMPGEYLPTALMPNVYAGYSCQAVTKYLVDAYEMTSGKTIDDPASGYDPDRPFENRDARLNMTVLYPGGTHWDGKIFNSLDNFLPDGTNNPNYRELENSPWGGMMCIKFIKPIPIAEKQQYDAKIIAIRLAEMYLTYAEAAIETNQNKDMGLQYINLIRQRVDQPQATELTRDLVRRERRVELAYEGLRYFDIKRWDIGSTALGGPVIGCRDGTVNMVTGEVTWFSTYLKITADRIFRPECKYLLPIPQTEVDVSGMAQNPGY